LRRAESNRDHKGVERPLNTAPPLFHGPLALETPRGHFQSDSVDPFQRPALFVRKAGSPGLFLGRLEKSGARIGVNVKSCQESLEFR
jgi:hypothetical protein